MHKNEPRWAPRTVTIDYNIESCAGHFDEAQLRDLIVKATDGYWNRVPHAHLKLVLGNPNSTAYSLETMPNEIIIMACNPSEPSSVILATGAPFLSGSRILGAWIVLNTGPSTPLTSSDPVTLARVVAHELGHVIGIGHSDKPYALMYFSLVLENGMSDDDANGMAYLYPANPWNAATGCAAAAQAADRESPATAPDPVLVTLLFTCLFVLFRLRFRVPRTYKTRDRSS